MNRKWLPLPFACLLCMGSAAGMEQWKAIWQYDELESRLDLRRATYRSNQQMFAVGTLREKSGMDPVVLESSDGGLNWSAPVTLPDPATDVFCLPLPSGDGPCWISTSKSILQLDMATRKWKKLSNLRTALTIRFSTPLVGLAAGTMKSVWTTSDGGKKWTKLKITDEIESKPEHSNFHFISTSGPLVFIGGSSVPPREDEVSQLWPDWMVPEDATARREIPRLFLSLQSTNSGQRWSMETSSTFGHFTNIVYAKDRSKAYALAQMRNKFEFASGIIEVNLRTGKSRELARFDLMATDLAMRKDGLLQVFGVEALPLRTAPIPSRVRAVTIDADAQSELVIPVEQKVDYRAVGKGVRLVTAPDGTITAVVDTGMFLQIK